MEEETKNKDLDPTIFSVESEPADIEEYDDETDHEVINVESESDDPDIMNKVEIDGDCWRNINLIPKKSITCIVSEKLFNKIKVIEKLVNKKFTQKNEFSIYIHSDWNEDGDLVVSDDFYIPKQNVGVASVDYIEQPDEYYNGCLHKHPDGCLRFSETDQKYINSNFEFSLLYVCKEIKYGIVNLKYFKNRRIQVPVNVVIDDGTSNDVIDIENICKEELIKKEYNLGIQNFPRFDVKSKEIIKPNFESMPYVDSAYEINDNGMIIEPTFDDI